MLAIAIARSGGPEVLVPVRRPVPVPGDSEVLIAVAAAGINNSDLIQRRGESPAGLVRPDVPGLEVAGRIAALGSGVTGWDVGERVCALTNGGGYAQFCTAPAGQVLPLPHGCGDVEAAALPEGLFTVWSNLVDVARLADGETLLVHGGASGMGTLAIQLARSRGARVLATAGTAAKCAACTALGAEEAFDYRVHDFVAEVLRATRGKGADVILDMVGGDYVMRNIRCLARGGRIVNIAFPAGAEVGIDFMELMRRNGSIAATMLRPRPATEKAAIARQLREQAWPLVARGQIRAVVARTFALAEAAEAHRVFERGGHIGKLMLAVPAA
jgi:putative PIG3 family NAD(P)H quinone oxidoreductase